MARRDVEFAHNTGVAAATRETDERTGALGLDDVSTAPHPVLVLFGSESVHVDEDIPLWRVFLVLLKSRAAPDAPCVHRIAPEVVQVLAGTPDRRDLGVGFVHLQRLGAHRLEAVIAQFGERRFVVLTHPGEGLFAGDLFEP